MSDNSDDEISNVSQSKAAGLGCDPDTQRLCNILENQDQLYIACHLDPDPDAIASAAGLRKIAKHTGVSNVKIVYGGEISHQENRAMINLLDIEMKSYEDASLSDKDQVVLVDHSSPAQNSPIPTEVMPLIVIDHHSQSDVKGDYVEQLPHIGATATVIGTHLQNLSISSTERIATALYFAIYTETRGFTRGITPAEHEIAARLSEKVDYGLVRQIQGTEFTQETLDGINVAITNREIRGSCLVSFTELCDERDVLPQAADYLLRLEGVTTSVVFGVVNETVQVSARTTNGNLDIGKVLHEALNDIGSAGGHDYMAGGEIPLGIFAEEIQHDDQVNLIDDVLRSRIFGALEKWTIKT